MKACKRAAHRDRDREREGEWERDSYSWGRVTVVIVFIFNKKAKDGCAWAKPLSQGQRDADRREGRGAAGSANVQQLLTHCAGYTLDLSPEQGAWLPVLRCRSPAEDRGSGTEWKEGVKREEMEQIKKKWSQREESD